MRRLTPKRSEEIIIGQQAVSVKETKSKQERVCLGIVLPVKQANMEEVTSNGDASPTSSDAEMPIRKNGK